MAYDYSLPTEDYHQIYRFLEISQNDFNQKEISKLKKHFGKLFGAPTLFDFREQVSCTQHDSNRWTVKRSLPVNSLFKVARPRCCQSESSAYHKNLWNRIIIPQDCLATANGKHLLEVPNVRLKSYGDRAFSVAAPKQWNDIPLDIKLSGSVDVFKSRLKTYLFRLAFIWLFVLVLLLVSYFLFWL